MLKPYFFKKQKPTRVELKKFPVKNMVDIFTTQNRELFDVLNPHAKFEQNYKKNLEKFLKNRVGQWIYFPWNQTLLHTLLSNELFLLRTNRNRNLINNEEQNTLANFTAAVIGLSIGNSIALNLLYNGISRKIKIADLDTLETSNLNRVRASLQDVGKSKISITAAQIYEIDPYASIYAFEKGIQDKTLKQLFANPKPKIIFEAIDDLKMKIQIRLAAKKAKIPVVMLTNLGNNILIDVERYDLDKNLQLFNGLIGKAGKEILNSTISEQDKQRYAVAIVGKENVPLKALDSLREINRTLVGRPQLMSTVTIGSGIASLIAKKIALGEPVKSGRSLIKLEQLINF